MNTERVRKIFILSRSTASFCHGVTRRFTHQGLYAQKFCVSFTDSQIPTLIAALREEATRLHEIAAAGRLEDRKWSRHNSPAHFDALGRAATALAERFEQMIAV